MSPSSCSPFAESAFLAKTGRCCACSTLSHEHACLSELLALSSIVMFLVVTSLTTIAFAMRSLLRRACPAHTIEINSASCIEVHSAPTWVPLRQEASPAHLHKPRLAWHAPPGEATFSAAATVCSDLPLTLTLTLTPIPYNLNLDSRAELWVIDVLCADRTRLTLIMTSIPCSPVQYHMRR